MIEPALFSMFGMSGSFGQSAYYKEANTADLKVRFRVRVRVSLL